MKPKAMFFKAGLLLLSMLLLPGLTGCGAISSLLATPTPTPTLTPTATSTPPSLSDAEFSRLARDVCSALATELASLDSLDFTAKAKAYSRAAEKLTIHEITKQSAPQSVRLREGLVKFGVLLDSFGRAFDDALKKANMEGPLNVYLTEGGYVYVSDSGFANIKKLEINSDLVLELYATEADVKEAATLLGLKECAVPFLTPAK